MASTIALWHINPHMFVWLSSLLITFSLAQENPLQVSGSISNTVITPQQIAVLKLQLDLPDGYFAYADKFKLTIASPEGFKIKGFTVDPLKEFFDDTSKQKKVGVIKTATLIAPFEAPLALKSFSEKLVVKLEYQACTKTYCLFPQAKEISIPFQFEGPINRTSLWSMDFKEVIHLGLPLTLLFVFIAGVLTSFTPCVYPMIPITLSVLGRHAHLRRKRHNLALSLVYVCGIALTYSLLGVLAAASGALFGSFMTHPLVLGFICLVFLAMALSMFGLYDIQAPSFIRTKFAADHHIHGYLGVFISGVIAGAIASPCVGPVLVGILTYVAQTQNLWTGFLLLFVFALGMGQLFIALGVFSQFTKILPKSGPWMDGIKHFFGLLMSAAFYYYLSLLVPQRWFDALLGLGLVIGSSLLGAFTPISQLNTWGKIRKGICMLLIFIGSGFVAVAIFDLRPKSLVTNKTHTSLWHPYSEDQITAGKPIIIDFWAEWCAACLELEEKTFSTEKFQAAAKPFKLLKFDASKDSSQLSELKKKYHIIGLPTVVFIDKQGQWRKDLTVNEFIDADAFIKKMEQITALPSTH